MSHNNTQQEDIIEFTRHFQLGGELAGARVLVTGGTGLIGSSLVQCLLALNQRICITLPVRNLGKAKELFGENKYLCVEQCDLVQYVSNCDEEFDYIIHCASPTSGKYIDEHPVETFELALESTRELLKFCRRKAISSMVYVSSLEYYGQNLDDCIINEDYQGYVDPISPRSSYPFGKRSAEFLCVSYALEFGVPVKIARLTQTFGAGISYADNRVFAQFARSIIKGEDIVLHTLGESAKPYCYSTDCVSAILYILLKGCKGEAYNVANEDSYITIKDLAMFLVKRNNPNVNVRVELHSDMGYAPVTKLHLSTQKLRLLGWKPMYDLQTMFDRLIAGMREWVLFSQE